MTRRELMKQLTALVGSGAIVRQGVADEVLEAEPKIEPVVQPTEPIEVPKKQREPSCYCNEFGDFKIYMGGMHLVGRASDVEVEVRPERIVTDEECVPRTFVASPNPATITLTVDSRLAMIMD